MHSVKAAYFCVFIIMRLNKEIKLIFIKRDTKSESEGERHHFYNLFFLFFLFIGILAISWGVIVIATSIIFHLKPSEVNKYC